MKRAKIIGTGMYLPEKILTNADLEKMVDTNDEWIRTRTGIQERRIAGANESSSDLAIPASKKAIEAAGIGPEDIDAILVCTTTPDMFFPSTASFIQAAIGARNACCMDISAACSGFLYGLFLAKSMVESDSANHVLLIGVDTLSKLTNWKDRSTCILFGDGAGAAIVSAADPADASGILSITLGTDGTRTGILTMPGGGSRVPFSQDVLDKGAHFITMDGPEVYKSAVTKMPEAALKALQMAGYTANDLKLLIPHQANLRIIESVGKRMKIAEDKVFVNVQKYGNMSAATTIVALDEAVRSGRVQKGDLVELVAFGAGLTWAASVMRW